MSPGLVLLRGQLTRRSGRVVAFVVSTLVATILLTTVATLLVAVVRDASTGVDPARSTLIRADGPSESTPGLLAADAVGAVQLPVAHYRERTGLLTGIVGTAAGAVTVASADPVTASPPRSSTAVVDEDTARTWGVRAGDQVEVLLLGETHRWTIAAVTSGVPAGPTLWVPDTDLMALPGPAGLDAIVVESTVAADVVALHPEWSAQNAAESELALAGARAEIGPAVNALSLVLAVILTATGIVLGTTLSLWAGQRSSDLVLLRALGVTSATVWRRLVADALLLAGAAALIGTAVAQVLVDSLSRWLGERAVVTTRPALDGVDRAIGAGSTWLFLAVACVAIAASSVRGLQRTTLSAGVRGERPPRSPRTWPRGLIGVAMLGLAAAPLITAVAIGGAIVAAGATAAALFAAMAATVLAPWILPAAGRPVRTLFGLGGSGVGTMVASNLRHAPVRTAAVAAPVVLAIGVGASFLLGPAVLASGTEQQVARTVLASSVTTGPPGALATAPPGGVALVPTSVVLDPDDIDEYTGADLLDAHGVSDPTSPLLDLDVVAGDLATVNSDSDFIAVATGYADQHGWEVGRSMDALLADGSRTSVTIGALYERDLLVGTVVTSAQTAVAHTRDPRVDAILSDRPAPVLPAGAITSGALDFASSTAERNPVDDWITIAIVAVIAGYAGVSTATAAGLATAERARELDLLRMTGSSRTRLVTSVVAEIAAAVLIGVLVGALIVAACVGFAALHLGVSTLDDWTALGWAACGPVLCLGAAVVSAVSSARPWRGVGSWSATVRGES